MISSSVGVNPADEFRGREHLLDGQKPRLQCPDIVHLIYILSTSGDFQRRWREDRSDERRVLVPISRDLVVGSLYARRSCVEMRHGGMKPTLVHEHYLLG